MQLTNGTLLLGLSEENVKRMMEGHPIEFDGKPFGFPGKVGICYGETEESIVKDILAVIRTGAKQ